MNPKIKISQLPAKGANLAAADLLEIAEFTGTGYVSKSITGQELIDAIPAAIVDWGNIGGTLSDQTDLNTALSGKVPTTRTLTINGTTQDLSADRTFTISSGITIGTTAITSGTVGRVLFEGTGNVVQESAQLSWNNSTNSLLVTAGKTFSGYNSGGSASDALKLELTGGGAVLGIQNSNASGFSGVEYLNNSGSPRVFTGFNNLNGQEFRFNNFASGGYIDFLISATSAFRIFNTRNIGINTTTDAGYRLDVNGTARVQGNAQFGTGLYWSNSNNRLGIGTSSPSYTLDVNGTARFYGGTTAGAIFGSGTAINLSSDAYMLATSANNNAGFLISRGAVGQYASLDFITSANTNTGWSMQMRPNATRLDFVDRIGGENITMSLFASSRNLAIGTTTDVASSLLTLESTTKGFLPPRMTTTQRNAITSPATGLVVYDTTLNKLCVRTASTWETITSV